MAKASAVADGAVTTAGPLDGFVFGGDSAFEVDGQLYGKPHDPAVARRRWRQMLEAGGGTLWSGHCVIDRRAGGGPTVSGPGGAVTSGDGPPVRPVAGSGMSAGSDAVASLGAVAPGGSALVTDGDRVVAVDSAVLTFADDVSPAEIDAYVATGEPLEVAGAFTIDGRAAAYITRIDGAPPPSSACRSRSSVRCCARASGSPGTTSGPCRHPPAPRGVSCGCRSKHDPDTRIR